VTAPTARPAAPPIGKPVLLDAYCGAGGAAVGYARAGFTVVGVDIEPQKHYPFEFHQGDAIEFIRRHGRAFDAIHASPPCQAHTALRARHADRAYVDLVGPTRVALLATDRPYVIENVPGAPLLSPLLLCGTMFGLGTAEAELRRHRLFESSVVLFGRRCQHGRANRCVGVYGGHARNRRRMIGVYGHGPWSIRRKAERGMPDFSVEDARASMGIDWMTMAEMSQAIPPAYSELVGGQLLRALEVAA
jgi:DNA (cytosine-5)-methyltransferase 1